MTDPAVLAEPAPLPTVLPDPVRALETAIAEDIHAGLLAPGMWLKQILLQERYGHSRGDVRRVLDRLVAQRLVEHVPNYGYRVHQLDPRRLEELRQVRLILEVAAAEMVALPATPEQLARLRALAQEFSDAAENRSILDQNEANLAFHAGLLELCPNRELARQVMETRLRMPAAPLSQWGRQGWVAESARQHHAMVDALAEADAARYRALVRAHIRSPSPTAPRRAKPD
ncbi:transcriptional regulator [Pseudoroseomonas deserti]|uniref:Transcriptional regulator n=1 Tax=Teichococcus deserti TaxID=1817963 RepID=A0A1V2H833_9PROT|nr:GntR family transcriptional regulator [Pseudoroseomonas deserti]ONG57039.1 transcriptional regulator [Pseudoroseomonas deserti]